MLGVRSELESYSPQQRATHDWSNRRRIRVSKVCAHETRRESGLQYLLPILKGNGEVPRFHFNTARQNTVIVSFEDGRLHRERDRYVAKTRLSSHTPGRKLHIQNIGRHSSFHAHSTTRARHSDVRQTTVYKLRLACKQELRQVTEQRGDRTVRTYSSSGRGVAVSRTTDRVIGR